MNDITYCVSKNCKKKEFCQRYIENNDLKNKIYSASDFTPKGNNCGFYIGTEQLETLFKCGKCGNVLDSSPQVGRLGLKYIHCSICGEDNYKEELGEIELNSDNVKFPQHYFNYGNGKYVGNDWINEKVKECLKYLEENPSEDFVEFCTGNTNICVLRYSGDNEYRVVVTRDYYDTYIPIKNYKK